MSAFGIIQLHDDITRSNGNYCSICFRSASDRRLVDPVFLNIFLMNTYGRKYFKKPIKACYICEALATSAVRFQRAVELASQVGVLYDDITATGHWQSVIKCLMDKQTNKTSRGITGSILQRALAMDKTLKSAPRHELHTTDTLVVSSVKDKSPPPPTPAPAPPARPPPPLSDTVVIVDDEPPPAPAHVRVLNQETDEVVLHPVLKGSDGKLYVPSLHLQMLDGGLFQGVTDVQMQNLLPLQATTQPTNNNLYVQNNSQTPQPTTQPNNNLYVENNATKQLKVTQTNNNQYVHNNSQETFVHTPRKTYSNTRKSKQKAEADYYNFLLTQNNQQQNGSNSEIIKMNDMNIVLHSDVKKRRLPEDPLNIDSTNCLNKQHVENTQGTEIRYEIIDDDTETPANGMTESRRPVLRTDQTVDWEDKIPMDVISFMDATDPNPSERIMQPPSLPPPPPLAVIADVRSVPDVPDVPDEPYVPDDPDVTHVPELIECIDLC